MALSGASLVLQALNGHLLGGGLGGGLGGAGGRKLVVLCGLVKAEGLGGGAHQLPGGG